MTKPERPKELINLAFGLATKQVKAYNYIKLLEAYIEHLEKLKQNGKLEDRKNIVR